MKHRLFGNMAYACGAMDRAPDGGVEWRLDIQPFVNSLGVGFLNPCDKPISVGVESPDSRQERETQKDNGDFDRMSNDMKIIRSVDLRMVDLASFLIVNIDLEHYACGTIEEIVLANRQKKPILIHVQQGKRLCPDWILGMLGPKGHDMIFDKWADLKKYLTTINSGSDKDVEKLNSHCRWVFFDFNKIFNSDVAGFDV